jgi:hypothetical protein
MSSKDELQLEQEMEGHAHQPADAETVIDPVTAWKREQWERLGVEPDEAVLLAALPSWELDYHDVENLMAQGCTVELALEVTR